MNYHFIIIVNICAISTKCRSMILIQISGNVQSVNVMVNTEYQFCYLEIILVKCKSYTNRFKCFPNHISSGMSLIVEVWSLLTLTPVPFHSSFRSTLRPRSLNAAFTLSTDCG